MTTESLQPWKLLGESPTCLCTHSQMIDVQHKLHLFRRNRTAKHQNYNHSVWVFSVFMTRKWLRKVACSNARGSEAPLLFGEGTTRHQSLVLDQLTAVVSTYSDIYNINKGLLIVSDVCVVTINEYTIVSMQMFYKNIKSIPYYRPFSYTELLLDLLTCR